MDIGEGEMDFYECSKFTVDLDEEEQLKIEEELKKFLDDIGAEYLVYVFSRSLKRREKYTNRDNLICVSLYIFEDRAIYIFFYKIKGLEK